MDLPTLDQVTVVVVTHHSAHCVADMARTLAPFPHVVVVDNAPEPDTRLAATARACDARYYHRPDLAGIDVGQRRHDYVEHDLHASGDDVAADLELRHGNHPGPSPAPD